MEAESQKTQWLRDRKNSIGSSDAAVIWNESKWCTPIEMWNDKMSEEVEEEESFIMERGNIYEPTIRKLFSAEFGLMNIGKGYPTPTFQPLRVRDSAHPHLTATLDGYEEVPEVISEYKYQGMEAHQRVDDETLPVKGGRVPLYYWIQVQHQLMLIGKEAYFVSYNPKDTAKPLRFVKVEKDAEFIAQHFEKCNAWWTNHMVNKVPPEETSKDYKTLRKKGSKGLATRWLYLKAKIEELEEEQKEIREKLLAMVDHDKMTCHGLNIYKVKGRAGSVDYAKIPEVKALSKEYIEGFRKPAGKESYTFKPVAEEKEKETAE